MGLVCNTINAGAAINCLVPPIAGVNNVCYMMNKDDVASMTTETDGSISAISMKTGKQAFKFETGNTSINGLYTLKKSGVLNGFTHTGTIIYPADDQAAVENLAKFANSNVIMIINRRGEDGFGTFLMLGKSQGLVADNIEGDYSSGERDGLPFVTMSTDEQFNEKKPPVHVLDTDYATTLTALEALLTPAA